MHDHWLERTREALYNRWVSATGHRPDANYGTWACEIAQGCRTCNEHLSLPCSLLAEANEIGAFLGTPCFDNQPVSFFRLYLVLLSEFVNQLRDVSSLLGVTIGKPPKDVVVWANRWAKHRLHILVQHHPQIIFADGRGEKQHDLEQQLAEATWVDRCGNARPVMVITRDWLCGASDGKRPDLNLANGEARAVIVVPPMQTFLDQTCAYFRKFIDAALTVPNSVRQFQSEHFRIGC